MSVRKIGAVLRDRLSGFAAIGLATVLCATSVTSAYANGMALPGSFDVNEAGAATYSVSIAVPPGTAGMAPALSLEYSSQGSDGSIGIGWSISGLPSIGRCARTVAQDGVSGSVNYDGNDRFCIDGQRLVAINGAYGANGTEYRTEIDRFTKIVGNGTAGNGPAWFEVRTKAGHILQLGNSADSRLLAAGKSSAHAWAVNRIADTAGNYLAITYVNDAANTQLYPSRIDYTGNTAAGLAPYNSVQFVYATRPDIVPLYQAGSLIKTTQRLTNVQAYVDANLVTDYRLAYNQSSATGRSRLVSITQCDGSGICLPATSFSWQQGTMNQTVVSNVAGQNGTLSGFRPYIGDFNGDGMADVFWDDENNSSSSSTGIRTLWSNSGAGTFAVTSNFAGQNGTMIGYVPVIGDFNRDGKSDVWWSEGYSSSNAKWLSTNTGWSTIGTVSAPVPAVAFNGFAADSSADTRDDLWWYQQYVFFELGNVPGGGFFWGGWETARSLTNADGSSGAAQPVLSFSALIPESAGPAIVAESFHADFNGDGRLDVLFHVEIGYQGTFLWWDPASGGAVTHQVPAQQTVFLDSGNGTFSNAVVAGNPWVNVASAYAAYKPTFLDLNGDGKVDILWDQVDTFSSGGGWPPGRSNGSRSVWLSRGDGTFNIIDNPGGTNGTLVGYRPLAGDFNGDGKVDVLWFQCDANFVSTGARVLWQSKGDGTFTVVPNFGGQDGTAIGYWPVLADFNGDGKTDILWDSRGGEITPRTPRSLGDFSGTGMRSTGTRLLWLSDLPAPDLMTGVTTGIGATVAVNYKPLTDSSVYTKDNNAIDPTLDLRGPMQVVSRVDVSNGIGGIVSSTYAYAGAKANLDGRGFLGFRQVTATDLQTSTVKTVVYRQDYPYQSSVASATRTLGGVTLSSVTNTYGATSLGGTRYDVYLQQTVENGTDLGGTALPTLTTTYQYDAYGNATQAAAVASDGLSKTTAHTYVNDTANWLLGRLTTATVTAQAPLQVGQCSLPWGGSTGSGQSVTAYSSASPPAGQTCSAIAQTRTCINGTLSGSYTQQSCSPSACSLPWGGSIADGQSVTAYSAASPPAGQTCSAIAQTRTCANGTLSGSHTNQSCVVTDDTPNSYSFTDLTNQPTTTVVNSNIIQITGINVTVTATTAGASSQMRSCADSACSSVINTWASSVSITANQYLQVRQTTSSAATTTTTATVTVGTGTPDTWSATTGAGVTPGSQTFSTPGAFTFTIPNYNNLTVEVWGGGGGGGGYYYPLATGGGQSNWNSSAILANGGKPGPTYGAGESYDANHGYGGTAAGGTTNLTGGAAPLGAWAGGSSPNGGAQTSGAMQPANAPGGGGSGGGVIGDDWGDGGGGGGYAARTYSAGAFTPGANIGGNVGAGGSAAGADFQPTPGAAGRVRFTWN